MKNFTIMWFTCLMIMGISSKLLAGSSPSFIENKGQIFTDKGKAIPDLLYYLEDGNTRVFFFNDRVEYLIQHIITIQKKGEVLDAAEASFNRERAYSGRKVIVSFNGCEKNTQLTASGLLSGVYNFIRKNVNVINVGRYSSIRYENIYEGIDLVFTIADGKLKSSFFIKPFANPAAIKLLYSGAINEINTLSDGSLEVKTALGSIRESKPLLLQEGKTFYGKYDLKDKNITYSLPKYDNSKMLEIDPLTLFYSTYLGGTMEDIAQKVVNRADNEVYVTGNTYSTNYPTLNAYDSIYAGNSYDDVFVTKLNPLNKTLYYSTYIGGSKQDFPNALDVDMKSGEAIVAGQTNSNDYPTNVSAYDTSFNGAFDGFITRLSASGSAIMFSTYLGGSSVDRIYGLKIDSSKIMGKGIVYGGFTSSSNFPIASPYDSSYGGSIDGFVGRIYYNGTGLHYSSYVGGSGYDEVTDVGVTIDPKDNDPVEIAYIGRTMSTDLKMKHAIDTVNHGGGDAFVGVHNSYNATLKFSTYLGGNDLERPTALTVWNDTVIIGVGITKSNNLNTVSAYQSSAQGGDDAFIIKLNPYTKDVYFASYLGSSSNESPMDVCVGKNGDVHLTGFTEGTNFPNSNGYATSNSGKKDIFIAGFDASNALLYSSYFGGTNDDEGLGISYRPGTGTDVSVVICGSTKSDTFPLLIPYDTSYNTNTDGFVTIFKYSVNTGLESVNPAELNCSLRYLNANQVEITFPENSGSFSTCKLYAMDAREMHASRFEGDKMKLDLSSYPKGMYLLQISNATGAMKAFKLMIH